MKIAMMILALVWMTVMAGSAVAASPADGVMTPVKTFIDAFNKGDIPGAAATHVADVSIIDEFPPHQWRGPSAFTDWVADLQKDAKAKGQTDQSLKLGKTLRSQVDGDTAYVVVAATFVYKEKGKSMKEPGQLAFALGKDVDAWKIVSWAWAGTTPRAS